MKTATLVAVIAAAFQVIAYLCYTLRMFEVISFPIIMYKIIELILLLSSIGIFSFFIALYQKQTKN